MIDPVIKGLREAQRWNARAIASMKPTDAFGRAIQTIITQIHRHEVSITHVGRYWRGGGWRGGGTLRASLRMEFRGLRARTYIDPNAINPISRSKPSMYGVIENARGGEHAFAERTVDNAAPAIVNKAMAYFSRSVT